MRREAGYNQHTKHGPLPRKTEAWIYHDCSPDRAYAAAVRAATEMGYTVISSDASVRTLSFRTGMSMGSWQGQEMTATVIPEEGGVQVIVGGRRVTRGFQLQLYDWGEARKIAGTFFRQLDEAIKATPERVAAQIVPSSVGELERLAQLHERGALTDAEFGTAKQKLLA